MTWNSKKETHQERTDSSLFRIVLYDAAGYKLWEGIFYEQNALCTGSGTPHRAELRTAGLGLHGVTNFSQILQLSFKWDKTKTHLTALWCCPRSLKSWTLVFRQTAEYSQGILVRLCFWTSHYFYSSFGWILKKRKEKKKWKDSGKLEQKGVVISRNFLWKKTISQVRAWKICWFWLTHHIHTSLEVKSGWSVLICVPLKVWLIVVVMKINLQLLHI